MPTIYAASESTVLVDGDPIEGVQGIDYRTRHERTNIYALGSTERVGVVSGAYEVQGRIRVTSASAKLDALGSEQLFQIIANLRHGDTEATVTFDDCCLTEKTFDLSVNGQGSAVYAFSAARMR
ncbi:hypothetical protein [Mycolicibacterium neworleansense]|uniref:Uncharacterized protein n=1 Tax=Mycolicibacterium neworleansense TaxID=146018 RepID=A0A0H5RMY8_9MYCO|nr:hypothetical protein [Mycolicibacterium neworleansense]MCV7363841.1 hypothetical protein [Mycolicibacterium neworleansense]CRZ14817.1 hypothetical protein BN2156_01673 [Mycolicibacterium neworleansense]